MVCDQIKSLPIDDELAKQKKDEAVTVITSEIFEYMDVAGEFNYEDKDDMINIVTREVNKYDFFADSNFEDRYLLGKLINILADQQKTVEHINIFSEELTNKYFSGRFGVEKLIEAFEKLYPALIRIYSKVLRMNWRIGLERILFSTLLIRRTIIKKLRG